MGLALLATLVGALIATTCTTRWRWLGATLPLAGVVAVVWLYHTGHLGYQALGGRLLTMTAVSVCVSVLIPRSTHRPDVE
jgi:hypothetical protein